MQDPNASPVLNTIRAGQTAVEDVRAHEQALRAAYDLAVSRLRALEGGYEPVETVVKNARRLIDEAAAIFARSHALGFVDSFSRTLARDADGHLRGRPARLWPGVGGPVTVFELYAYAPGLMKDFAERAIRAAAFDPGPAIEDRPALLSAAERDVAAAEAAHESFIDEAAALGITLPFLPSVKARREREAAARQRVDAERDERERLVAEVEQHVADAEPVAPRRTKAVALDANGAPAVRGGGVRSKYLDGEPRR